MTLNIILMSSTMTPQDGPMSFLSLYYTRWSTIDRLLRFHRHMLANRSYF